MSIREKIPDVNQGNINTRKGRDSSAACCLFLTSMYGII